jgi:protein-S-isoprenylcysteine O-methyltransferase Ste14
LLTWLAPLGFAPMPVIGTVLAVAGLGLIAWAALTMRAARTTILPHRGADALVTRGPFGFSRNPIYLGDALLLAGIGLIAGSAWMLVMVPLFVAAVTVLAIRREEAHLARRFGPVWDGYRSRVRRWL